MKLRIPLLVAAAILVSALPSLAQQPMFEFNPFGGYLFGGTFDKGSNAIFNTSVDVDDHATYGARFGFNINKWIEVEAHYSRVETHFVSHESGDLFGPGNQQLGDLDIDYFLGYGTFFLSKNPYAKPYVTIGLGAAHLNPHVPNVNATSETRFTASLGGGVKTMFTPHFGMRFDGRVYWTDLGNGSNNDHHDHSDCSNDFWGSCGHENWLTNGDVTGGFVIAW
jgi:opacity protein-like surface antigen